MKNLIFCFLSGTTLHGSAQDIKKSTCADSTRYRMNLETLTNVLLEINLIREDLDNPDTDHGNEIDQLHQDIENKLKEL